jgi:hypothetical protein
MGHMSNSLWSKSPISSFYDICGKGPDLYRVTDKRTNMVSTRGIIFSFVKNIKRSSLPSKTPNNNNNNNSNNKLN